MMTAELVGSFDLLCKGYVGGGCGVYFYGRRAGGGEDLGGCYSDGEDVGDVGWRGQWCFWRDSLELTIVDGMRREVLF